MYIRVRLFFEELIPGYNKKSWFLFDTTSCRLVADLEHLIQRKFELRKTSSVNLYNDGFLLPAQEKIELVRDGDIIRVEQRGNLFKDKRQAKWNEDVLVSDVKPSKKRKLDGESQKRVNIQAKKIKSNKNQNHETKSGKKPINKADSKSGKSDNVKVAKPCKGNNIAVQKGKNRTVTSEKYASKNATVTRNRTVSSSSESSSETSSTSSSIEDTFPGKWCFAKRAKIGNFSKGNKRNSALLKKKNTLMPSSSSTSSSSISDLASSSSLSEDYSDDAFYENIKSSDKINVSFSSSSSSSMLSSSSSESSEDLSDNIQEKGLNPRNKNKCLHKNTKTKAKIQPAATPSIKKQNKNVKNLSKTSKQTKKDSLKEKTKENNMDKNMSSKATASLYSEGQVEISRSQSNVSQQETQNTHLANENTFPITANNRSKNTHALPESIKNSHIRFDSDEENNSVSACRDILNSSTAQNHDDKNSHDAAAAADDGENTNCVQGDSEMPSHNNVPLINGEMNRNGNEKTGKSIGHASEATKKTAVDYNTLLALCGPPRVGDRIAYKVLELSASYTPEMSDYKEGTVLGYNPVTNEVSLELTDDSLTKPLGDGNVSTKFELIYEDEDEQNDGPKPPAIVDRKVCVPWTSMVDPRLITSS